MLVIAFSEEEAGKVETMLAQQESSLGTSAEERGEKEPDAKSNSPMF